MLFLMIRLYSSEMRVIIVTGMNPFEFVYILQIFFSGNFSYITDVNVDSADYKASDVKLITCTEP